MERNFLLLLSFHSGIFCKFVASDLRSEVNMLQTNTHYYTMIPDNKTIETRLQQLREEMRREHLSAFIFPSADPHMSEYVPERWEGRKWISGFDGSAGTAVVTLHGAALWTDSRYFLAAEEQLDGTEFALMRERVEGTPSIAEWIGSQTEDADDKEVGVDGMCISLGEAEALTAEALEQLLADTKNTSFHRSTQYESSYLYHKSGGTTLCVWYESEADLAEKTELCKLLGIKNVYVLK